MRLSRNNPRFQALALMAAKLTTHGMDQKQVGLHLDVSQPQVSRLLAFARENDWLITELRINEAKVPSELLAKLEQERLTHEKLDQRLEHWTPPGIRCRVRVIDALEDDFCRLAADWVADLVLTSEMIGVMYGRTASQVVAGISQRYAQHPPRTNRVRVIPISAEPVHLLNAERNSRYSSTYLAAELHESLTGQQPHDLPSLRGVPAYIATDFGKSTLAAIREFVNCVPGYRRIFIEGTKADPTPLIERVDTILTGIGTATRKGTYMGTFLRERLAQETKVTLDDLRQWVFGDIGGVLLSKPGLDAKARKAVEAMNAGLLGLTADHFRATARRASQSGKPGCVIIASGKGKAEIVCACIQSGMVNELVINSECASALEALPEEGVVPA